MSLFVMNKIHVWIYLVEKTLALDKIMYFYNGG